MSSPTIEGGICWGLDFDKLPQFCIYRGYHTLPIAGPLLFSFFFGV